MFKTHTHTHIQTHTPLYFNKTLITLHCAPLLLPFLAPIHSCQCTCASVWQCALPTCVFNYVQYVCIRIRFVRERVRVSVCVFEGN